MSGKNDPRKILNKQKRFTREWLLKPGTGTMKTEDVKYIEEDLQNDAPAALLNISDSLRRPSTWYASAGQIALLDGSVSGWTEIHRAWLYRALALRVRISLFQKGRVLGEFRPLKSLETEASDSALCLAYALVVRREFEVNFFGDAVRVMLMDKDVVREAYWEQHNVESFSLQLLALSRRESLDVGKDLRRGLGVYQPIVDAWTQPSSLANAIQAACDFHCQRIEDKSDKFAAEFRSPPFDLVPAEILAVYSVRETLGLDTPRVVHPLFDAPFNVPAGSPAEVEDPLLDQVEAKL